MELIKSIPNPHLLEKYLEDVVKKDLKPDVSNYAKGRLRVWIDKEPMLFAPFQVREALKVHHLFIPRIKELTEFDFDFILITYSGDEVPIGIEPHRDAGYADFTAVSINVSGECKFDFWENRQSKGLEDPKTFILTPGAVTKFNCKHLHAATPTVKRWNINLWKKKPQKIT